MKFRLGTRRSALAKIQSQTIQTLLKAQGITCELIELESEGDIELKKPLYEIESQTPGLFTKHLERALIQNEIDLAVHSLKDLPTLQPSELKVGAITERMGHGDLLLVSVKKICQEAWALPQGALVGTSSLRREAQLLSERPDVRVTPLRGNVPTRVEAVRRGKVDAAILAAAGLERLSLSLEGVKVIKLPVEKFVPAPGQGALAVEIRSDAPAELAKAVAALHHPVTAIECQVERKILRELEGGCTLPLGVLARISDNNLNIKAFLGVEGPSLSGQRKWAGFKRFDKSDASEQAVTAACLQYFRSFLKR